MNKRFAIVAALAATFLPSFAFAQCGGGGCNRVQQQPAQVLLSPQALQPQTLSLPAPASAPAFQTQADGLTMNLGAPQSTSLAASIAVPRSTFHASQIATPPTSIAFVPYRRNVANIAKGKVKKKATPVKFASLTRTIADEGDDLDIESDELDAAENAPLPAAPPTVKPRAVAPAQRTQQPAAVTQQVIPADSNTVFAVGQSGTQAWNQWLVGLQQGGNGGCNGGGCGSGGCNSGGRRFGRR